MERREYTTAQKIGRLGIVLLASFSLLAAAQGIDAQTVAAKYPSPYGTGKFPDGFFIKSSTRPEVYVIRGGKKSIVHRPIFDRWVGEAHYINPDVVITLTAAQLASYPDTTARNHMYMGRILESAGKRYFIDDKLRKRPITPAVQAALKYPGRNVYGVPANILSAFPDGPAIIRTDIHPGGTVVYRGAYHGGTIWLIRGDDTKHEFLQDYVYESMGFPWSSQILPISVAELAKYKRGAHLSTYPDGWIIGKGTRRYLAQGGRLRWIASDALFSALKYNPRYVFTVFPQFFTNYAIGEPVTAFGSIRALVSSQTVAAANTAIFGAGASATPGPVTMSLRVPPETRRLIANVNTIFLTIYDRNPTASENAFWVDYLYKGEAQTETAFRAALSRAKTTGVRPVITSRTAVLAPEVLLRYVNFLFYYVFGRFPDAGEKAFWDERVTSGLRRTIEDLGGNMQFLKDQGLTRR